MQNGSEKFRAEMRHAGLHYGGGITSNGHFKRFNSQQDHGQLLMVGDMQRPPRFRCERRELASNTLTPAAPPYNWPAGMPRGRTSVALAFAIRNPPLPQS